MPRGRRTFIPGISVHVIQRGNNRVPIFGASNDFEQFLELLRRSARNFCVTLHAFVLMTTHYLVQAPHDYQWSSYSAHAFGRWPTWLTPHTVYQSLGRDDGERQRAYRELCGRSVKSDDPLLIL